jgi:hypothetical protein
MLSENALKRRRQHPAWAADAEEAMCEYDIIMQILPGSSDDGRLINVSGRFCNSASRLFVRLTRLRKSGGPVLKTPYRHAPMCYDLSRMACPAKSIFQIEGG